MADDFAASSRPRNMNSVIASLPRPQNSRLKIISMGAETVGKSCIIKRYCEERFIPKYIGTIGIDYGVKKVAVSGHGDVRVNFWDLAGGAEFLDVRNEFYKDAQGALLVFDVTNPRSFAALDSWVQEAQKHGVAKEMAICVCANKIDAGAGGARKIQESEGRRWAESKGFAYFETSAHSGAGIASAMEWLFKESMNSAAKR